MVDHKYMHVVAFFVPLVGLYESRWLRDITSSLMLKGYRPWLYIVDAGIRGQ